LDSLIPVLTLLLSGGLLTALVQGALSRRKTSAETTDVITQAADRLVARVSADNEALRSEVSALRGEIAALKREFHEARTEWERERAELMAALGNSHP
jgi:outer membrane murein-binding lipoprotein Lpp